MSSGNVRSKLQMQEPQPTYSILSLKFVVCLSFCVCAYVCARAFFFGGREVKGGSICNAMKPKYLQSPHAKVAELQNYNMVMQL